MIFIYSIRQGFHRKIGITNKPKSRMRSIRKDYKTASYAVILPTPFVAPIIEKSFHRLLSWFQNTRKGSGKTEWFRLWPFGWVVDWMLTGVVFLSWYGVYRILLWIAETY